MFIHRLEGNWLEHPFWRSSFLLEDPEQLSDLRCAQLDGVVIDTTRGRDLAAAKPAQRAAPAAAPTSTPARRAGWLRPLPAAQPEPRGTAPQRTAREFGQASRVAERGTKLVTQVFYQARLGRGIKVRQIEPVVDDIYGSIQRNPHAFNGLMRCRRDNTSLFQHALAVCGLMVTLARQLQMPPETIRQAGMTGLLIDVGIGLLHLDAGADHGERSDPALLRHPQTGADFLRAGGGVPDDVALACLEHHERCDGSGYPQGLRSQDISRLGRMVAICEQFDALANGSGGGLGPALALERLRSMNGKFDQKMLDSFCEAIGLYPIGSVVLLGSGRLGIVVDQPSPACQCLKVRAFFSTTGWQRITSVDVPIGCECARDEIIALADPATYGIVDFPRLREQLFAAACTTV
ncbi:MAG: DUF3391 domain-containing protein [Proteobacteria bacterium]|nr:DUF3391 domain-containing protein [Pseudomonadota bacterium]